MASIHSKNLSIFNAKQFRESVSEPSSSNVYLTFGRCYPWTNENAPPQGNTSVSSFYEVWNNMIGAKKITGNDIRHCIPRVDWATDTVYNSYNDLEDSKTQSDFYVMTDDYRVYKCIANNYGANSTTKPTSTSTTSDFQTIDGYVWKFMYELSSEEQLRFLTDEYIPVREISIDDGSLQWLVQNNAISGAIHNILITNGGTYTANDISITITGDGQDANAFAVRNVTTNAISSIVIDNKGINYTFANVVFSSPTGSGGIARAIISPRGGHGSDALTELGGSNLVVNMQFKSSEGSKITVQNDFRQLGMIENPYVFGSSNTISNTVVSQLTVLSLSGSSAEYIEDEYVYQGSSLAAATFKAVVTEWDSSNNKLKVSNVVGTPGSELVIGNTSTAARFLNLVTDPDMERFTGNLLYLDNIRPIERAEDQTEDFKIIFSF